MDILDQIRRRASQHVKRIVFPEAEESRTLQAVARLAVEKIVAPVLLGDPEKIHRLAEKEKLLVSRIEVIVPARATTPPSELVRMDYQRTRARGVNAEGATRP